MKSKPWAQTPPVAIAFLVVLLTLVSSCSSSGGDDDSDDRDNDGIDYRAEMRSFVMELADWARETDGDFIVVPQNGQELFTDSGDADGEIEEDYLDSINGSGRESMFYGYYGDDEETPPEDSDPLVALCRLGEEREVRTLAVDYCSTPALVEESYRKNTENGFIPFAAGDRELGTIPMTGGVPTAPRFVNQDDVESLVDAKNFLYLINGERYDSCASFAAAVRETDYDVVVMDAFQYETSFSAADIESLKEKKGGGRRIILAYMSIGEAEDYRYYWKEDWLSSDPPDWLEGENPDWEGNYKVRYWDEDWKGIIFGNDDSYLKRILGAGFDGVYLDIIDGFEYFEDLDS